MLHVWRFSTCVKAYGQFEPPALYDHVVKMVELGKYDTHLLEDYTEEEFEQMNGFIDHWRDMNFSYAAVKQLEGKYRFRTALPVRFTKAPSSSIFWWPPACSQTTRVTPVWIT